MLVLKAWDRRYSNKPNPRLKIECLRSQLARNRFPLFNDVAFCLPHLHREFYVAGRSPSSRIGVRPYLLPFLLVWVVCSFNGQRNKRWLQFRWMSDVQGPKYDSFVRFSSQLHPSRLSGGQEFWYASQTATDQQDNSFWNVFRMWSIRHSLLQPLRRSLWNLFGLYSPTRQDSHRMQHSKQTRTRALLRRTPERANQAILYWRKLPARSMWNLPWGQALWAQSRVTQWSCLWETRSATGQPHHAQGIYYYQPRMDEWDPSRTWPYWVGAERNVC